MNPLETFALRRTREVPQRRDFGTQSEKALGHHWVAVVGSNTERYALMICPKGDVSNSMSMLHTDTVIMGMWWRTVRTMA
jgi:hypothetical protein